MIPFFRRIIPKLGRTKTIIALTFIALGISLLFTMGVCYLLKAWGMPASPKSSVIIASSVTLLATPILGWFIVTLILGLHELEEEMRTLANHDALTGLLCRRAFFERAKYFHKVAKREELNYSIVMVDIDSLKQINDNKGHIAGDQVLESFGNVVREIVRESDLACRYGGDEFVFLLPYTSAYQACHFTKRLHALFREPVEHPNGSFSVTASMGLASFPENGDGEIEELIAAADIALYRAKQQGGNRTLLYKPDEDKA